LSCIVEIEGKIDTKLLVFVPSHAGDDRRDILRETWLQDEKDKVKCMFVVGNIDNAANKEAILREQAAHKDIFILETGDDYDSLTDKVLVGFKLAYETFNFEFMLKTDTDSLVFLPRLFELIKDYPRENTYVGVQAWRNGDIYKLPSFRTPYMLGGGYLLSRDLVEYFADYQHKMNRYFAEDLTVGAHFINMQVNSIDIPRSVFKVNADSFCACDNTIIINHKCRKMDLYTMYYSMKVTNNMCSFQTNATLATEIMKVYNLPSLSNEEQIKIHTW